MTVELKNDIRIRGTLKSVDQYLNIKLDDVDVLDLDKYPHLSSVKNMFIRGSVVRYVVLPRSEVDVGLLEDATRRGTWCFRLGLLGFLISFCSFPYFLPFDDYQGRYGMLMHGCRSRQSSRESSIVHSMCDV